MTRDAEDLSGRELAVLRKVAGGRTEMSCSLEPDLFIDGVPYCDQFDAHQLARRGFIEPARRGRLFERVPAVLTTAGWMALHRHTVAGTRPAA